MANNCVIRTNEDYIEHHKKRANPLCVKCGGNGYIKLSSRYWTACECVEKHKVDAPATPNLEAAGRVTENRSIEGVEARLDQLFDAAFSANHKAMLDYVALKFELKRLRKIEMAAQRVQSALVFCREHRNEFAGLSTDFWTEMELLRNALMSGEPK